MKVALHQPNERAMHTPTHIRATSDRNGASDSGVTNRSMT
jgi:hypothetical protein